MRLGVTIGRGSVVGAGTVVAKDVPPLTVATSVGYVVREERITAAASRGRGRER